MRVLLQRWIVALSLVVVTYNPTGFSYLGWVAHSPKAPASIVLLAGAVVVFGFVIFIRAGVGAIGWRGLALHAVWLSLVLWVLSDLEIVDLQKDHLRDWAFMVLTAWVLALGASAAELRRMFARTKAQNKGIQWGWK